MKLFYLVTLIFISSFLQAQTSVYHPFPDSAVNWNFTRLSMCNGSGVTTYKYSYFLNNDTVISGIPYHQLWQSDCISETNGFCFPASGIVVIPGGYVCGIREDVPAKKLYIRYQTEQLLYDFNLQVGDTIKGYLESFNVHTVLSIDSVLIDNNYHKSYLIDSCYNVHITEGIGMDYGLIAQLPFCVLDLDSYFTDCIKQNGVIIYPDGISTCEIVTGLNSVAQSVQKINISPNPSDGIFKISVSDHHFIKQVFVNDLYGKNIFNNPNVDENSFTIDKLSAGIYILTTIQDDGVVFSDKIISCN